MAPLSTLTAEERMKALEEDRRFAEMMTSGVETGVASAKLSDQPEQLRSIFNGVIPVPMQATASRDSGLPLMAALRDAPRANATGEGIQQNELRALNPEDLTKSRDSKPGGLVSPKTPREKSIEEAQGAVPPATMVQEPTEEVLSIARGGDQVGRGGPGPRTGDADEGQQARSAQRTQAASTEQRTASTESTRAKKT